MARNLSLQIISKLAPADLKKVAERDFQDAVLAYAKDQGWKCHWMRRNAMVNQKGEWHPLGSAGFPDVLAARWTGVPHASPVEVVALELKAERGQVTPEQEDWLLTLAHVSGVKQAMVAKPRDAATVMQLLE